MQAVDWKYLLCVECDVKLTHAGTCKFRTGKFGLKKLETSLYGVKYIPVQRPIHCTFSFTVRIACRANHCRGKSSTCSPSLSLTASTTWTRFGSRSRRCSGCSRWLSACCRSYDETATTSTWRGSECSRRGMRTVRRGTCRNSPLRRRSFLRLVCIETSFYKWCFSQYNYYLFIMPQTQHRRTQTYKTRKIMHNKTTIKLQICSQWCRKRVCHCHCTFYTVSATVDLTPYLLHRNMKSEDTPGKHIKVLSITFLHNEILR